MVVLHEDLFNRLSVAYEHLMEMRKEYGEKGVKVDLVEDKSGNVFIKLEYKEILEEN